MVPVKPSICGAAKRSVYVTLGNCDGSFACVAWAGLTGSGSRCHQPGVADRPSQASRRLVPNSDDRRSASKPNQEVTPINPFGGMASSEVSRGRDTSCVDRLTLVDQPRPLVVTCSFTTVVCPVSLERCSAVSMRLGANAHCTWQVEVIASSRP
jgi:hypothetical protein